MDDGGGGCTGRAVRVTAVARAPVAATWALLATPDRWPDWAPHIRTVEGGATGRPGVMPVAD